MIVILIIITFITYLADDFYYRDKINITNNNRPSKIYSKRFTIITTDSNGHIDNILQGNEIKEEQDLLEVNNPSLTINKEINRF
ncbi:hypothetical protein [Candidatus Kinetoplastidibacterium desouzai]|nr:hypothetical protein [Candidatus Kinetoplastibacterium desouzaii]